MYMLKDFCKKFLVVGNFLLAITAGGCTLWKESEAEDIFLKNSIDVAFPTSEFTCRDIC